jgi:hypothetical protein
MSSQTFYPFSQLPIELRLKIWAIVLESPRIIPLYVANGSSIGITSDCMMSDHIFIPTQKVPALLHTCQETRFLSLPKYKLGFDVSRDIVSLPSSPAGTDRGNDGDWLIDEADQYWESVIHLQRSRGATFFPCAHESIVRSNDSRKELYWDPDKDIVLLNYVTMLRYTTLAKMAYVWSSHGYSTTVNGIKSLAMSIKTFNIFSVKPEFNSEDVGISSLETVYIILKPKLSDDDQTWEAHKKRFLDWYGAITIYNKNELKLDQHFEVRVVRMLHGVLDASSFLNAESVQVHEESVVDYDSVRLWNELHEQDKDS